MSVDVTKVMAYENGELNAVQVVDFFAELIRERIVWSLQGSYGRTATALIDANYISQNGDVLRYPDVDEDDEEEDDEDYDSEPFAASYNPATGQYDPIGYY